MLILFDTAAGFAFFKVLFFKYYLNNNIKIKNNLKLYYKVI